MSKSKWTVDNVMAKEDNSKLFFLRKTFQCSKGIGKGSILLLRWQVGKTKAEQSIFQTFEQPLSILLLYIQCYMYFCVFLLFYFISRKNHFFKASGSYLVDLRDILISIYCLWYLLTTCAWTFSQVHCSTGHVSLPSDVKSCFSF